MESNSEKWRKVCYLITVFRRQYLSEVKRARRHVHNAATGRERETLVEKHRRHGIGAGGEGGGGGPERTATST